MAASLARSSTADNDSGVCKHARKLVQALYLSAPRCGTSFQVRKQFELVELPFAAPDTFCSISLSTDVIDPWQVSETTNRLLGNPLGRLGWALNLLLWGRWRWPPTMVVGEVPRPTLRSNPATGERGERREMEGRGLQVDRARPRGRERPARKETLRRMVCEMFSLTGGNCYASIDSCI